MSVVEAVIADNSGVKKLFCYNRTAFNFIKTGNALMLLNVLNKSAEVVARSESRLCLIPTVELPDDIKTQAENLAEQIKAPTVCQTVTVKECLDLPAGTVFNIICKITVVRE